MTGTPAGVFFRLKRQRMSGRKSEHNVLIGKGKAKPISVTTKVRMKVTTKVLTKVVMRTFRTPLETLDYILVIF
jgi:hypothetical protein